MALPLIAGLLGAGWLFGNDRYQRAQAEGAQARRAEQVKSLLGTPARELAGPTRSGEPLMGGGTGLLGGEITPQQFHAGLLTVPGYEDIGARGLLGLQTAQLQGQAGAVDPAAVREWEYYSKLPEEQQAAYLRMKRADPTFRMNDVTMLGNQVTGTAIPFGAPGQSQAQVQDVLSDQAAAAIAKEENVKLASKRGDEAFSQLERIKANIANYDEALSLIDQGAQTGVIMSRLPSVRAASIALDNLQGRLGLDVIGNTTFGALSEAELRFALDTALPKGLDGPELKRWLLQKREAQHKLAGYLEEAALFLGTPGNTVKDWIELQRRRARTGVSPAPEASGLLPAATPASRPPLSAFQR